MTIIDPVRTAARTLLHVREVPAPATRSSLAPRGTSSYTTAPGAVPVRIGSYRRGARASRPAVPVATAELTYGDFFATPGA
ncbi:hypothetical protein [Frigoribacterium sp. PvP032]|uniref:hypothetical protein n=1 Tax=Frigoribacterium sp. PvP032 TaxID=2806589 RepID=UPI001AE6F3D9|nr:hypothetical protein [Frigoribacterium sp. PvP032]MBP1191459.1 hypothetical protein [Frigoribacterium sp. PvP032]